jgi:hypothetical protein
VAAGARNRREVAGVLAARGALREEVDVATAADAVWAMCSSELYRMLVVERGWNPQSYEQWLSDVLTSRLLERPMSDPR